MKTYLGTKLVKAAPLSRQDYNDVRNWTLPDDENGDDEGYLVEYTDGGTPNHQGYKGYISWSPKAQFDAAYRETTGLTFGLALEALKAGERLTRSGWNGAGLWLEYRPASGVDLAFIRMSYPVHSKSYPEGACVPWLASQTDMLAEDWSIL
jgi:hypothetical protein